MFAFLFALLDSLSTFSEQVHCYSLGCSCMGVLVDDRDDCRDADREANRRAYPPAECTHSGETLILPSDALVGMSVYDLDGGENNEYIEQLVVGEFEYFKTPLRPSSGNDIHTTLLVDRDTGTFTSNAAAADRHSSTATELTREVRQSRAWDQL